MQIIIAGAGEVGTHLAKMLSQENHDIIIIDPDENKLKNIASSYDVMTRVGSATSISFLLDCNIKKTDLFITVMTSEDTNITASILGKKLGAAKTIARIDNAEYLYPKYIEFFKNLGIDYMIYPEQIAAKEIINQLEQSGPNELINFEGGKLSLYILKINENSPIVNKTLNDAILSSTSLNYRIITITRNGQTIIPRGKDSCKAGDIVYIISKAEGLSELELISKGEKIDINKIMIIGGSKIGYLVAKEAGNFANVKIIETDREKSYKLSNSLNNALVINGDGRDMNLLNQEGLANMDALVAVTGNSETNILACIVAGKLGVKKTIAEIENIDYIPLAENMGITTIINKKIITAGRIFRFTISEAVTNVKCLIGTDTEVLEFVVNDDAKITKYPLNQIDFPEGAIIGGVIRGENSFITNGYTLIKPGDKVIIFSLPSAINKVARFF